MSTWDGERDNMTPHDVPHARDGDVFTSHAAGHEIERVEGKTTTLHPNTSKHVALRALARLPRSAIEVEVATGKHGIWKRVSDLKNAHLIEPVGHRKALATGRDGIVWSLNERGRAVLERLDAGESVKL